MTSADKYGAFMLALAAIVTLWNTNSLLRDTVDVLVRIAEAVSP